VTFGLVTLGLVLSLAGAARAADVTDKVTLDFAKKLEKSLAARDKSVYDSAFDFGALADRVLSGLTTTDDEKKTFTAGVQDSFPDVSARLMTSLGKAGTVKLLRVRETGGDVIALLRYTFDDGTFSYEELYLDRPADGPVRIVDIRSFMRAELMSERLRRSFLEKRVADPLVLDGLRGSEKEFFASLSQIQAIRALHRAKKEKEALAALDALPSTLRTARPLLLLRRNIARAAGPQDREAALEALEKAFGDEPSVAFLLADGYVVTKHYDAALAALDRLDRGLGGDPYVSYQRALVLKQANKRAESRAAAAQATDAEPTLAVAWWYLVELALEDKAFSEVAKNLTAVENQAGVEIVDLTAVPVYADFVKSREFAAWFAARKAAARRAIEKDPADRKGYWKLVTLSLHEKNYAETVQGLDLVEEKLKVKVGKLTEIPIYSGFVKSKEYAAWMEKRSRK
jgi:hypothetical protein